MWKGSSETKVIKRRCLLTVLLVSNNKKRILRNKTTPIQKMYYLSVN